METLLQNEHVVALIGAVAVALGLVITALAHRAVRAIEGWGARQAEERRRDLADEVTAAVETLYQGATSEAKLQEAQRLAWDRGVDLDREEIEAALRRAEGQWRRPEWVEEWAEVEGCEAPELEMT